MSFSVKLNTDDGAIAIFQTVHQNMAVPATPVLILVKYGKKMGARVSSLLFCGENIKVTWSKDQLYLEPKSDFWEIQLFSASRDK